jgi:LemA protein
MEHTMEVTPRRGAIRAQVLRHARTTRVGWLTAWVAMVVAIAACQRYDRLVELDQIAEQRWADVQAQLQRRHDLIPNW